MDLGIADKTALVSGATSGIGKHIARVLAAEGARVVVAYFRQEEEAGKLANELGAADGRALAVRYDLADPEPTLAALAAAGDRWDEIDILVANAVRMMPRRRSPGTHFEEVSAAEWQPVVTENLVGAVRLTQLVLPGMRDRGWGRIALLSSHIAEDGHFGQEFYGAAKCGLHGFARSLSWDAGPSGVLVNVVSPGLTLTERALAGLPARLRDEEAKRTATGRLTMPEETAAVIAFVCSAANGNMTGETFTVAGGR
jgi:NAD(P)-dependent dehydrogenase (short-subunit alcohol dehydrogenase family)